jgi:hypothetical protein
MIYFVKFTFNPRLKTLNQVRKLSYNLLPLKKEGSKLNLKFVEQKCVLCGVKLSEFEYNEKSSCCIGCYRDEYPATEVLLEKKPTRLRNKKLFANK